MAVKVIKIVIGLAAVALAGWQVRDLRANLSGLHDPGAVPTTQVKREEFIVGIGDTGALTSRNVTTVSLGDIHGTVVSVVKDGIQLKPGDDIVTLDAKEIKEDIDKQELELNQLNGRIASAERERSQDVDNAERDVKRLTDSLGVLKDQQTVERDKGQAQVDYDTWQQNRAQLDFDKESRLADHGLSPRQTADIAGQKLKAAEFGVWTSKHDLELTVTRHQSADRQTQGDIANAEFQVEAARQRISGAGHHSRESAVIKERDLAQTRARLDETRVTAPVSGLLMLGRAWSRDEGWHTIKVGDDLRWHQKVADICNLEDMQVPLIIDELRASKVRVGQEAIVRFDAVPGREFKGAVVGISPIARQVDRWDSPNAPRDMKVFDVVIGMRTFDAAVLRPGMSAEVQIVFARVPRALVVPAEALQRRGGKQVVYVSRPGGWFVERPVVVGRRGPEKVEIVKGLRAGERVAISAVPRSLVRGG
jgi:HlyD family secretion protein